MNNIQIFSNTGELIGTANNITVNTGTEEYQLYEDNDVEIQANNFSYNTSGELIISQRQQEDLIRMLQADEEKTEDRTSIRHNTIDEVIELIQSLYLLSDLEKEYIIEKIRNLEL